MRRHFLGLPAVVAGSLLTRTSWADPFSLPLGLPPAVSLVTISVWSSGIVAGFLWVAQPGERSAMSAVQAVVS